MDVLSSSYVIVCHLTAVLCGKYWRKVDTESAQKIVFMDDFDSAFSDLKQKTRTTMGVDLVVL